MNTLKKVEIANNKVDTNRAQTFFNLPRQFYSVKKTKVTKIDVNWSVSVGEDVYVCFDVLHWKYLEHYCNIPSSHAFVFLYLGRGRKESVINFK